MTAHDPACPQVTGDYPRTHCLCELIAGVRRSTADRIAAAIESQASDPCDSFDRNCQCGSCVAHQEAIDAVLIAHGIGSTG